MAKDGGYIILRTEDFSIMFEGKDSQVCMSIEKRHHNGIYLWV